MTQNQREKMSFLIGKLEGLTWGVADCAINEGLSEVVSDFSELLDEVGKTELRDEIERKLSGEDNDDVPMISIGGKNVLLERKL